MLPCPTTACAPILYGKAGADKTATNTLKCSAKRSLRSCNHAVTRWPPRNASRTIVSPCRCDATSFPRNTDSDGFPALRACASPHPNELIRYIFLLSAAMFLGHGFGAIPAPGSFADSALFGSSRKIFGSAPRFFVPLRKSVGSLWEQRPLAFQCSDSQGQKRRF